MTGLLRPCLECGEPSEGAHCPEHARPSSPKTSAASRGYDAAWRRLSAKARKLQGFCSDCGATEDLQTDHSAEAWRRKAAGKPIRMQDVDVVCGPCNRKRGAARCQQTPARAQQTRPRARGWGMTPSGGLRDPRGEAKFGLHTRNRRPALRPANSRARPANKAAA